MHAYRIEIKNDSLCCTKVQVLCSPREEPCIKIFLVAQSAFPAGKIKETTFTVNLDVVMLVYYFANEMPNHIYLQIGTDNNLRSA